MTVTEAVALPANPPILFADGVYGLVIRVLPHTEEIGVQVPYEDDITWVPLASVRDDGNGALVCVDALALFLLTDDEPTKR